MNRPQQPIAGCGRLVASLVGLAMVLALPGRAAADDLESVFKLALDSDPQYQAAIASHDAALEAVPQSLALLLPEINLTGDISRNRFHERDPDPGEKKTSYYTNRTYAASLRQSVYRRDRFIALEQADSRVAQADAELESAYQDLIIRVARRYFVVLGAMDNLEFVRADIKAVVDVTHDRGQIVKVIFENCYLNDDQKIRLCEICGEVGADFVKTSTGYGEGGATTEDLKLMRKHSPSRVQVKAAGGVRTLDRLLEVRALGVTRVGASRTVDILEECKRRLGR